MKVLSESNWNWMLYKSDESFILSVLCGSVGMFTREIVLSIDEVSEYLEHSDKAIEKVAQSVRSNPEKYQSRQIPDFHLNEAAKSAASEWRSKHAQKP